MAYRPAAEFVGTFLLVFGGCGAACSAASPDEEESGRDRLPGVLAFGLTVLAGVYAFGVISGGHFQSRGDTGRRTGQARRAEGAARVLGGAGHRRACCRPGDLGDRQGQVRYTATGHMAANGYGAHSPFGYSLGAVLITEVLLTFIFLLVILGATDDRAPRDSPAWRSA